MGDSESKYPAEKYCVKKTMSPDYLYKSYQGFGCAYKVINNIKKFYFTKWQAT